MNKQDKYFFKVLVMWHAAMMLGISIILFGMIVLYFSRTFLDIMLGFGMIIISILWIRHLLNKYEELK